MPHIKYKILHIWYLKNIKNVHVIIIIFYMYVHVVSVYLFIYTVHVHVCIQYVCVCVQYIIYYEASHTYVWVHQKINIRQVH